MSGSLARLEISDLSSDEGLRLFVYDDATGRPIVQGSKVIGNPTLGIGRNVSRDGGEGLSRAEVNMLLSNDLIKLNAAISNLPWALNLNTARLAVVAEIAFQCGVQGMLLFHTMIMGIADQNWVVASRAITDSHLAPLRAKRLAKVMLTGTSDNAGT